MASQDGRPDASQKPHRDVLSRLFQRQAGGGATENRTAPRLPASAVPSITRMRFSPYGFDATLMNISNTGLLAELRFRMKVADPVTVIFEGGFSPVSVESHVVRCSVAALGKDGHLRYQVGIKFDRATALEQLSQSVILEPAGTKPDTPAQPVRNHW